MNSRLKYCIIANILPSILVIVNISALVYDIFTKQISKVMPNPHSLFVILILVNSAFIVANIIDYRKGTL